MTREELLAEMADLRAQLAEAKAESAALHDDFDDLERDNAQHVTTIGEFADKLATSQREVERLTAELAELKRYMDRCDLADFHHCRSLQGHNRKLKAENARLVKTAERRHDEIGELQHGKDTLTAELAALREAAQAVIIEQETSVLGITGETATNWLRTALAREPEQNVGTYTQDPTGPEPDPCRCPECGGPTTHDRELPPNPYVCDECDPPEG